jgi:hypothetical protein
VEEGEEEKGERRDECPSKKGKLKREGTEGGPERTVGGLMRVILVGHPLAHL